MAAHGLQTRMNVVIAESKFSNLVQITLEYFMIFSSTFDLPVLKFVFSIILGKNAHFNLYGT